jgi:hypothetical protein
MINENNAVDFSVMEKGTARGLSSSFEKVQNENQS